MNRTKSKEKTKKIHPYTKPLYQEKKIRIRRYVQNTNNNAKFISCKYIVKYKMSAGHPPNSALGCERNA